MKGFMRAALFLLIALYGTGTVAATVSDSGTIDRSVPSEVNDSVTTAVVDNQTEPPSLGESPTVAKDVPSAVNTVTISEAVPTSATAVTTAPAASLFASRFSSPAESMTFPIWQPTDCGCTPDPQLQVYAFFPLGKQAAPAQVNFDLVSRIAYFSLSPDAAGNIEIPKEWDTKAYMNVAERYAADVDLVISKNTWCGKNGDCAPGAMEFDKSYVLQNLIDEIVDTVKAVGAQGVTIDFAKLPHEFRDVYHFFITRLGKRLQQEQEDYQLNVVLHDIAELESLFTVKTAANELGDSRDSVDYFMIGWPEGGEEDEAINKTNSAFWKSGISRKKAIIVLDASDKKVFGKICIRKRSRLCRCRPLGVGPGK